MDKQTTRKVQRGGEVHPDNRRKKSDADIARHEQGVPSTKGSDTPVTTPAERQGDAKRITM